MNNNKFFLYARKSTDVEDKQVRSIEDQIVELCAFAEKENLEIVDILIEKQSAKIPGRPIFNEMLKRIEAGEADGILAWHPDRLARNSVDKLRKKPRQNRKGWQPFREKGCGQRNLWLEPVFPYKAARSAAESVGKIPESLILEPRMGLEPITSTLRKYCSTIELSRQMVRDKRKYCSTS